MRIKIEQKEQYQSPLVEFWTQSGLADMICSSPGNNGEYADDEW